VSSPVISGMFIAEEAHGAGDKGSGDTTTAICTAFFFEKIPTICLFHCCSCFFSAATLPKCRIFRISRLLDVRLTFRRHASYI